MIMGHIGLYNPEQQCDITDGLCFLQYLVEKPIIDENIIGLLQTSTQCSKF